MHCFTDDVTLRLRRVNKQRKREREKEGGGAKERDVYQLWFPSYSSLGMCPTFTNSPKVVML